MPMTAYFGKHGTFNVCNMHDVQFIYVI